MTDGEMKTHYLELRAELARRRSLAKPPEARHLSVCITDLECSFFRFQGRRLDDDKAGTPTPPTPTPLIEHRDQMVGGTA